MKGAVLAAGDTGTVLTLKQVTPVRLMKNRFALEALEAERSGATPERMREILGTKRERRGIFEGDLDEGELEAGQSAGLVREILPAAEVVARMVAEFRAASDRLAMLAGTRAPSPLD